MRGVTLREWILELARDDFNPHSPCVTQLRPLSLLLGRISTRTPHAGSDLAANRNRLRLGYDFNPHSPCGE